MAVNSSLASASPFAMRPRLVQRDVQPPAWPLWKKLQRLTHHRRKGCTRSHDVDNGAWALLAGGDFDALPAARSDFLVVPALASLSLAIGIPRLVANLGGLGPMGEPKQGSGRCDGHGRRRRERRPHGVQN